MKTIAFQLIIFLLFLSTQAWPVEGYTCPSQIRTIRLSESNVIRKLNKSRVYTEGFLFRDGYLYESRGLNGKSAIARIDAKTGESQILQKLSPDVFAEGISFIGNLLFQLSYLSPSVFEYSLSGDGTIRSTRTISYANEKWGLTTWNDSLVMSDGTNVISILDPSNFKVQRQVSVTPRYQYINELEMVNGTLLANLYDPTRSSILGIDLRFGCVTTVLNIQPLIAHYPEIKNPKGAVCFDKRCVALDFVANGIAFDPQENELYLTGKNWPYVFVIKNPL